MAQSVPKLYQNKPEMSNDRSSLVQCAISARTDFSIEIYSDLVKIKSTPPALKERPYHPPSRRKAISTFSRKSRKRMFEMMAKIRNPGKLVFVTLTYPDEIFFGENCTGRTIENHLRAFFARLERAYPDYGAIWRKEAVPRKSGAYVGRSAPHHHLIVRGVDSANFYKWVKRAWDEILGRDARVDVQVAHSRKHAYHYVSKYVAKLSKNEESICENFHNIEEFGRHWGYRGCWDLSVSMIVAVSSDTAIQVKRFIRSWLNSKGKNRFSRIASKVSVRHGLSCFGLGDNDRSCFDASILRIILACEQ